MLVSCFYIALKDGGCKRQSISKSNQKHKASNRRKKVHVSEYFVPCGKVKTLCTLHIIFKTATANLQTHPYPSPGQFEFINNFKLKYEICFTCRNYMYFKIWSSFLLRESYFCWKQKKTNLGALKKLSSKFVCLCVEIISVSMFGFVWSTLTVSGWICLLWVSFVG